MAHYQCEEILMFVEKPGTETSQCIVIGR